MATKPTESVESVTIRFAGDSGDGMQLTGNQYAHASAIAGNDLSTLPDFPAEIRAPAGTLAGVSGFQLQFSSGEIFTPGDAPDVLVAMNPAALQRNYRTVTDNGVIIVDTQGFTKRNLQKVGFDGNPLEDGTLNGWRVYPVKVTEMTKEALKDSGLTSKEIIRCKNFFALGLMFWLYSRPLEPTIKWIQSKFRGKPDFVEANRTALMAGYHFGDTAQSFQVQYEVTAAAISPGRYRKISGNQATAYGLIVGANKANLDLVYGSYPITPASDVLHELAKHKAHRVRAIQCEDEIAAVGVAIGASYAGALGVTGSSGPGIALKGEAIGLAAIVELPLVVLNVQRGGPSTGLPTKTEQSDLLQTLYGRNGDCPLPVLAASSPGDCFYAAIEATRVAVQHMTPVMLLSDGYLANGAEPWLLPDLDEIPEIQMSYAKGALENGAAFLPYERDERLGRPWAIPGTPGLEHRVGGLEKEHLTGNVSYDPENHERMTQLRAAKVQAIADELPPTEVFGPPSGEVLVLGWGSTFGPIRAAVRTLQEQGASVAQVHIRYINPLPNDLAGILSKYRHILIPEMNTGQLSLVIGGAYRIDTVSLNKIQGQPFRVSEIEAAIQELLPSQASASAEATL